MTDFEIIDRLKTTHVWVQPITKTNVFTAAINKDIMRRIVDVSYEGVGTNSIGIYRTEVDSSSTLLKRIQITANSNVNVNNNYNTKHPIFVMPGGTNLQMLATGNSISSTVTYWDDELV